MAAYPIVDLDQIEIDRKVGHLLPPEIAYRYHALPVATDGKRVTIAMASPEDRAACRAVQSQIEYPVFLIQADTHEIDCLLAELWPQESCRMKFMFWSAAENRDQALTFTEGIARLLGAELEKVNIPPGTHRPLGDLAACIQGTGTDLLVVQALSPFRMLRKLAEDLKSFSLPDILILPADPQLRLQKLLLITAGKISCGIGTTWALRFSRIDKVNVGLLPVLPPTPPCYGSLLCHDLAAIKAGNHPLGKDLRFQAERLREKEIQVTCKLRCGGAYDQIREEVNTTDPDLIILPAITPKGKVEWGSIDVLNILYKHVSKPILITH